MYCRTCGTQLSDEALFCGKCGTPTRSNAQHTRHATSTQPVAVATRPAAANKKPLIIAAAAVAAALVVTVTVFATGVLGGNSSQALAEDTTQTTTTQVAKQIDTSKIIGSWYVPIGSYSSPAGKKTKCNPYDTFTLNEDGTVTASVEITDSIGVKNATVTATGRWIADTSGGNYEVLVYLDGSKFSKYAKYAGEELHIITLVVPASGGSECSCTPQDGYFENAAATWMDNTAYRSSSSAKSAASR